MATEWRVTNQVPREELLQSGAFEPGWDVFYETIPEATRGSIWVPKRFYSPDYVRDLIQKEVTALKGIADL